MAGTIVSPLGFPPDAPCLIGGGFSARCDEPKAEQSRRLAPKVLVHKSAVLENVLESIESVELLLAEHGDGGSTLAEESSPY